MIVLRDRQIYEARYACEGSPDNWAGLGSHRGAAVSCLIALGRDVWGAPVRAEARPRPSTIEPSSEAVRVTLTRQETDHKNKERALAGSRSIAAPPQTTRPATPTCPGVAGRRLKLSQEALGDRAGLHWTYVSDLERGHISLVDPAVSSLWLNPLRSRRRWQ